jgi:hypothetical protein
VRDAFDVAIPGSVMVASTDATKVDCVLVGALTRLATERGPTDTVARRDGGPLAGA